MATFWEIAAHSVDHMLSLYNPFPSKGSVLLVANQSNIVRYDHICTDVPSIKQGYLFNVGNVVELIQSEANPACKTIVGNNLPYTLPQLHIYNSRYGSKRFITV